MRWEKVWEIARKDMASARRHRYVLYGLIAIPLVFAIILPLTSIYPVVSGEPEEGENLPPWAPPGMEPKKALVAGTVNTVLLIFMFLPAAIPATIASYTFVGEKVNRQLEPLLATPVTDLELLLGKSMGAFIPAMVAALVSFAGLVVVVDVITYPLFGYALLPNLLSLLVLLVYCPLVCLVSVFWCVFVSSRVSDARSAMQLGVLGVLPVMSLYFLFLAGIVQLDWRTHATSILLLSLAASGLLLLSCRIFRREEILVRWR
jgi:ABC-2 type transport system permease protein